MNVERGDVLPNTAQLAQSRRPHEKVDLNKALATTMWVDQVIDTHCSQAVINGCDDKRVPHPDEARCGERCETRW